MDAILTAVEAYTDQAHGEQTRKYSPDRYIVHPMRVMRLCGEYTQSLPVLAAAILHDVLEDTPVTYTELSHFLVATMPHHDAHRTLQLVVELTDVYVKSMYPQWNRRKRKAAEAKRIRNNSSEAHTIKYADILDNCIGIASQDKDFAPIFLRECRQLLSIMDKGIPQLRKRAEDTIRQELATLGYNR